MTDDTINEVVANFSDEGSFRMAVEALLAADFKRADLSVLASHDSLQVAEAAESPLATWLAALTGEVKYVGPLATAGLIAIATGPTGIFISGLVAAGVAGAAAKEFLDDLTAADHAETFAHAFESGGAILWVRVADAKAQERAMAILSRHGGRNIHLTTRRADEAA